MRVSATCATNARLQLRKLHKFFFPTLRQHCLCHRFDSQLTLPRRCFIRTGSAESSLGAKREVHVCCAVCNPDLLGTIHTCTQRPYRLPSAVAGPLSFPIIRRELGGSENAGVWGRILARRCDGTGPARRLETARNLPVVLVAWWFVISPNDATHIRAAVHGLRRSAFLRVRLVVKSVWVEDTISIFQSPCRKLPRQVRLVVGGIGRAHTSPSPLKSALLFLKFGLQRGITNATNGVSVR